MKRAVTIGGIIAACAACCAIPFLLPFVGLSVFGGGLLFGFRLGSGSLRGRRGAGGRGRGPRPALIETEVLCDRWELRLQACGVRTGEPIRLRVTAAR